MRILMFCAYYLPHVGGYEKDVHELARRLVQRGHQVSVLTCDTDEIEPMELIDDVMVLRVPCWNLLNGSYAVPKLSKKLLEIIRNIHFDLVMTHTRFFVTSLLGMVIAKSRKVPLVHVERGAYHSMTGNKWVDWLSLFYDHVFGKMVAKAASVNIGVSKSACKFIEHLGGKKTMVIHNGIDSRYIRQPHNAMVITFVGRLVYAKGVQDLLKAFEDSYKLHSNIKLFIVGDGNYRKQLEELANGMRCKNAIVFHGRKAQRQVMELLSISDVFVNPSYSEGLPTSVLEAASVGLPIVATDVGGTNEIIRNGVSGILVKPHKQFQIHKAIEYYLTHLKEAKAMGISAKTILNHKFSWDKIIDQYEEIMKGVCLK